jgi:hypothetical protein
MNYNPYAAPQAPGPQQPAPGQGGMPQPWELNEVLSQAWGIVKVNGPVLVLAFVVYALLQGGPGQTPNVLVRTGALDQGSAVALGLAGGATIFALVVGTFLHAGLIRLNLAAVRGQPVNFADLFSGGPRFLPLLGLQFLLGLAYLVGCAAFVVGMFFVALVFCLAEYYVVDAGLGPVEAMKASYEATKGQWGNLIVFGLVAFGLSLVGALACCVGVFVSGTVVSVAMAIIYTRLSGRGGAGAPPQPMAPQGYPPAGGGYPPAGGGYPPPGGGGYPPPGGGGYGPPPGGGGYGPPPGGGYGGPPPQGGGWGPPR